MKNLNLMERANLIFEGNKREIKAWLMAFSCPRSSQRRYYLELIKTIIDRASLSLGLTHNVVFPHPLHAEF
ncbi:unnamed protein product [Spirodela intermedia]|uniref:Uncharacterized protein n=1 Tax=Spirodela intermedia TaxID=51605 RepID=A0ABN7EAQ5_SPIIN|nr:unnamed protein product [Spirodela intermedia]